MDFYFDENFSHAMASALNELEKVEGRHRVFHTLTADGMRRGMKDEELIPLLGERRGILMTKDKKQTTRKAQHAMLKEHGVSAFFFGTPGVDHWEQMQLIMTWWKRITHAARGNMADRHPHYFTVMARGGITDWSKDRND